MCRLRLVQRQFNIMDSCSLYIHIPYCKSRCSYCDFHSGSPPVQDSYIEALLKQIPSKQYETVYIGGGTPSLLSPAQLEKLCSGFSCSGEFTIEANPDSLDDSFLQVVKKCKINRLSIGVQSLNNDALKAIGRRHDAQDAINAIMLAQKHGVENISVDLMVGIPFQVKDDIVNFAQTSKRLGVSHISCYMLKLEEGTPLYSKAEVLPQPDEVADHFAFAIIQLEQNGFDRYEISNFAKKGMHSRHNMRYWDCFDYLGVGPGAHSCVDNRRFYYPPNTNDFINGAQMVEDGICDASDYIILQTRLINGLSNKMLYDRFGYRFSEEQWCVIEQLEKGGLVKINGDYIALTDRGLMLQNSVLTKILT